MAEQSEPRPDRPTGDPQRDSPGRQVRIEVDESRLETHYTNAFRANGSPEEVLIDFGLNTVQPPLGGTGGARVRVRLSDRLVMSPYTAKRLVKVLGELVRRYEDRYGELELDVAKRREDPIPPGPMP